MAFSRGTSQTVSPGPLWGGFKAPLPTNAWWMNLVLDKGDQPIAPYPYLVRATAQVCCYPSSRGEHPWIVFAYAGAPAACNWCGTCFSEQHATPHRQRLLECMVPIIHMSYHIMPTVVHM